MAKNSCKCKPTECEECPEWIFTFADLVMLMMGFFVILWVLKPAPGKDGDAVKDDQYLEVLAAMRDYFNFVPDSQNPDEVDKKRLLKKLQDMKPFKGVGDGGRTKLEARGAEGTEPDVTSIRKGRQSTVGGRVLFASGDAALTPEAKKVLDEIVPQIKGYRNLALVKGHAAVDDLPENATDPQKLDLSVRRAQAVVHYLISRGVEPDILRVVGCSTYEPIAQRAYSPDTRQQNRRVEIESMATLVSEFQDRPAPTTPTAPASQPASSH